MGREEAKRKAKGGAEEEKRRRQRATLASRVAAVKSPDATRDRFSMPHVAGL